MPQAVYDPCTHREKNCDDESVRPDKPLGTWPLTSCHPEPLREPPRWDEYDRSPPHGDRRYKRGKCNSERGGHYLKIKWAIVYS